MKDPGETAVRAAPKGKELDLNLSGKGTGYGRGSE